MPAPDVEPTPVYTLSPTDDSAEVDDGEGAEWSVTDGLGLEQVDVVPASRLADALAGLAAGHGRAIDVGVGEDLWVRVHADGTTVVVDRPWGPQRYAEMRERDRRDRELLEALARARSRVGVVLRWVVRTCQQSVRVTGGAVTRSAGHARRLARSAWGAAVRAGRRWRPGRHLVARATHEGGTEV